MTCVRADIPGINLGDYLDVSIPVVYWNESVLDLHFPTPIWADFSLGDVIARGLALAKSPTFLSDLAQQTADQTQTTISVQGIGVFDPQNNQELLAQAAAQAQAQAEARTWGACP